MSKPETILRREQVEAATGLRRSTIYELMGRNEFPKSIQIGDRAVRWLESEVQGWIHKKIEQSRRVAA